MRKMVIVAVLAAALGLSACGATATLNQAITSLGASPDLQVQLTASVSGAGTAQAEQALGDLSLNMNYSNPTGAALSQSGGNANYELVVDAGGQPFLDVRDVDSNVYAEVDLTVLATVPSVNLSTSEVAALQLLVGGRWFEFPQSLISTYLPSSAQAIGASMKDRAVAEGLLDDLSSLISNTPYTTLPSGGFAQTGTLQSVVTAIYPAIASLSGTSIGLGGAASLGLPTSPPTVPGTYRISVAISGSTATGGSITITAPNGTQGNASVNLDATVTHNSLAIDAPANSTVITPSFLKELSSQAS